MKYLATQADISARGPGDWMTPCRGNRQKTCFFDDYSKTYFMAAELAYQ